MKPLMTIDQIRDALSDRTLTVVSDRTGIHHNTLLRIKSGALKNPWQKTIQALSDYLQ